MYRKAELLRMVLERWREFGALVDRIPEGRMEEPTLNPDGWSVKDLLWHMGRWYEEAARELEKVRLGTYVERDYETERLNALFLDEGRKVDLSVVRAEWVASR